MLYSWPALAGIASVVGVLIMAEISLAGWVLHWLVSELIRWLDG
ncbi:MAG: hypothetical protein AAFU79_03510 [Myxococcota bacterium]